MKETRSLEETFDLGGVSKRLAECLSAVMIIVDLNKHVQVFNAAAERLTKCPSVDAVGRRITKVHPIFEILDEQNLLDRTFQLGVPSELKDVRIPSPTGEGHLYFSFIVDPLLDGTGQIAGASIMAFDQTELMRLRGTLARQNEDLVILHEVSNVLRSTMDVDKSLFIICTALTSVGTHRNDHAMVFLADKERKVLRGVMAAGRYGDREIWKVWHDLLDPNRSLNGMLDANYPRIYKRTARLTRHVGKIEVPLDDPHWLLSAVARRKSVITSDDLRRDSSIEVHPELKRRFRMTSFAALPMMVEGEAIGIFIANASRNPRTFEGQSIKVLEMFADQAALAINNGLLFKRVAERAERDSLTGLYNHGHFQSRLAAEIDRARRYNDHVSLLLFDIDFFKHFNDTYGHQTGDQVLIGIGALLQKTVRLTDIAARYGGEEFVVVLPHTNSADASALAERLRQLIATTPLAKDAEGKDLQVTVSIGVASYPEHADGAEALIAASDAAMYTAKRTGRNRVVSAAVVAQNNQ